MSYIKFMLQFCRKGWVVLKPYTQHNNTHITLISILTQTYRRYWQTTHYILLTFCYLQQCNCYLLRKLSQITTNQNYISQIRKEVSVMNDKYLTTNAKIATNYKVVGKPLSMSQLEVILSIIAVYDVKCCLEGYFTVQSASNLITDLMNAIKEGKIQKRPKPYLPSSLMSAYINKYPDQYKQIIDRDL